MKLVFERTFRRLFEMVRMGMVAATLSLIVYEMTGDELFAKVFLLLIALYHTRFNHMRDQKTQSTE